MFDEAIKDRKWTDLQKLVYLRTLVKGDDAAAIESLPLTGKNCLLF